MKNLWLLATGALALGLGISFSSTAQAWGSDPRFCYQQAQACNATCRALFTIGSGDYADCIESCRNEHYVCLGLEIP
jgi:hypothetical protein